MSEPGTYVEKSFPRDTHYITTRITADGREASRSRPGATGSSPPRLPRANRAIIVRRLLGLEDVLVMGICGPTHDWRRKRPRPRGRRRPRARHPTHPGRLRQARPRLPPWHHGAGLRRHRHRCRRHERLQADDHRHGDGVVRLPPRGRPGPLPEHLRDEIEAISLPIYRFVNNGVYRCGFAGTQPAYDKAYQRLWEHLDILEEHLSTRRYLVGDHITEADVRFFTTLVRFDLVYHGHFKCNRNKLIEMPALGLRARPLPDAGLRRHDRLRPHQAALLHRAHGREPHRHRAARPAAATGRRRTVVSRSAAPPGEGTPPERPVRSSRRSTTRRSPCSPTDRRYAVRFPCGAREPTGGRVER